MWAQQMLGVEKESVLDSEWVANDQDSICNQVTHQQNQLNCPACQTQSSYQPTIVDSLWCLHRAYCGQWDREVTKAYCSI